jgi:FtsH-binding integral membrane protein
VVVSFLVPKIIEIVFLLLIAVIVFYNGFTDIVLALKHPRTKYILIPGMLLSGVALLALLLRYFPHLLPHLVIVTLGSFALVFGLFSIIIGYLQKDGPEPDLPDVQHGKTCQVKKP